MLAAPLRGKGYGPIVERHLFDRLPSKEGELLFGIIHPLNLPSLRSAIAVGTMEVSRDLLLPLAVSKAKEVF